MPAEIISRNEFLSHLHDTSMLEHRVSGITITLNHHITENALHKRDRGAWHDVPRNTVNRRALEQVQKDFGKAGYWSKIIDQENLLSRERELRIYITHRLPLNSRFIGWLLGWTRG